jgi:F0F1-type ATP synthase assembly protein I
VGDLPKKDQDPTDSRGIGKYLNVGLLLPISTFVGYLMGYGLDALFHTGWMRYVFLVLGTIAGFIEMIRELNKDV